MQPTLEFCAGQLIRLDEAARETFRHRSQGPKEYEAWRHARSELSRRWDELSFPGGLRSGLRRIEAGDVRAIVTAIRYLELRPFYWRAQFTRELLTRLLKRRTLPPKLQQRFDATRERLRAWRAAAKRAEHGDP